jgi:two-component system CheB/CheR fusion protein
MIYLDATLQKKMIPVFHYTLNPGGVLLLGTSETIGEFTDLFAPIDSKWKVYQRKEGFSSGIVDYSKGVATERQRAPDLTPVKHCQRQPISRPWPKKRYWTDTPLPVFWSMTNTRFCILSAGRKNTCSTHGQAQFQYIDHGPSDLKYKLTTALNKAFREKTHTTQKGVRIKVNGSFTVVDITVGPLSEKGDLSGLMLVVFEDKTPEPIPEGAVDTKPKSKKQASEIKQLEQDLQSTREYLQSTIEELETSNEELKSTNEEMQSVNEELQSTNEELETSKEELAVHQRGAVHGQFGASKQGG